MREGAETAIRRARADALRVCLDATAAADPRHAVRAALKRSGSTLRIANRAYDLRSYRNVYVIGTGKATGAMAQTVESILGDRLTAGIVTVKHVAATPTRRISQIEAGHPLPDAASVAGTRAVLDLADSATAEDLVICLISGGGSALLAEPVPSISLDEKCAVTSLMLRGGCTINEMNTVRKHLSAVKGGQLAGRVAPAELLTLIVSDVLGDPLDVIASGPTVPDRTTFAMAIDVLNHHNLLAATPPAVRCYLDAGTHGEVPETPKDNDPAFARSTNVVVANNERACRTAVATARRLGYHTLLLSTCIEGEAREVARVFAAIAKEISRSGRPRSAPACVVAGGETTVTVQGTGMGGRNQELALEAACAIAGSERIVIAAYATDGGDGPTDASGGIVDGGTVARATAAELDVAAARRNSDSYHCLDAAGDLLRTGPTGTNVNDLTIVLVV